MKKHFMSLLCLMLVLCFTLSYINVTTIKVNAQSNINILDSSTSLGLSNTSFEESDGEYIVLETDDYFFDANESVVVTYIVSSGTGITDFSYTQTGFSDVSISVDENNESRVIVVPSLLSTVTEHSIRIEVTLENGNTLIATLYAISNEHGVTVSPFSIYDAREKYLSYALREGIITQEAYDSIQWELSHTGFEEELTIERPLIINNGSVSTNSTSSSKITVNCTFLWTDDAGNEHPLRGVKVEICDRDSDTITETLAITHTNNLGQISCEVDNADGPLDFEDGGYDIFVRVYAGDDNAMVKNPNATGSNDSYYANSSYATNVASGSTISNRLVFLNNTVKTHAMQISQAVLTARNYAKEMMGRTPSAVTVHYPLGESCVYDKYEKKIKITRIETELVRPNSYASWDVIMHEYGHHIQHELGCSDNPGLKHDSSVNHITAILQGIDSGHPWYAD